MYMNDVMGVAERLANRPDLFPWVVLGLNLKQGTEECSNGSDGTRDGFGIRKIPKPTDGP